MTKKKRRGRRYRAQVSEVRLTPVDIAQHAAELPPSSVQAIERSSPTRLGEIAERHQVALADVKRSLVIGGAMFVLLIVLYLLLG